MNNIKDEQVEFLQSPNSMITDYSAMENIIMAEIVSKCAVPNHLLIEDRLALYESYTRRQNHFDDDLVIFHLE